MLLICACSSFQEERQSNLYPQGIVSAGYTVPKDSLEDPVVIPLPESELPRIAAGDPAISPLVTNVTPAG
ncbi:MAG: hypothetical protein R3301_16055, partial [Saprospiraceae bacterium]|nr:hypothetical protein [Saprospiraceae bacterium]